MRLKSLNSVHYIKEDDTFTPIQLQVIGYDNKPFDLSEAEEIVVKIGISDGMLAQKKLSDGTLTRMEVTGGLEFRLDVDDQLVRGANFIEVQGTINSKKFKAPSKGYYKLNIEKSMDSIGQVVTKITLDYFIEKVDEKIAELQDKIDYVEETREYFETHLDETVDLAVDNKMTPFVEDVNERLAQTTPKDVFEDFKNATGFSLEVITRKYELGELPEVPLIVNLWDLENTVLGTLSETSGNVNPHETNRTSDFIPIQSGENYSFLSDGLFKVVWYDENKVFIDGYGWQDSGVVHTFQSPDNAVYMRITVTNTNNAQQTFIANIGDEILSDDNEGTPYDGDFWSDVPTPPLRESSVKTHHIKDKSVTKEKLSDDIAEFVSPTRIVLENLWNIDETTTGTLNENNGNLNPHDLNRVSGFIPIVAREYYSFEAENLIKWIWYDENKFYIDGDGWIPPGNVLTVKAPDNAKYLRLNLSVASTDDPYSLRFIANIGTEIMKPEDEGKVLYDSFWDKQPDNVIQKRHLSNDVFDSINIQTVTRPLQPFPKTLRFKEISTGWNEVNHLSQDGEVVYFKYGKAVMQSLDDGDTVVEVCQLPDEVLSVQAIRDLADGELLISTTRDESEGLKSKVYKTVGYDRYNPENTQFVEVLEAISSQANIYSSWGLEAHDNICLASEYGLRGDEGARHVYLSTDYGETWKMIFDQKTTTQSIEGAPTWTTSAHLHTVHYDRYWNRIWLVVGDNPNTATYYSDDLGETWKHVPNSDVVQYTGIVSFPNGVIFGSDRSPNGLHVWKRTENKDDVVVIEPLKLINDHPQITHVFQRAFRRYAERDELALFPATRIADYRGQYGSVIMGFTDINNPYLLYELPPEHSGLGFYNAVGVTAKGNILTSYHNGSNHSILRAKAPLWE